MDMHSVDTDIETAANETKIVRMRRNESKTQYSPNGREIAVSRSLSFDGEEWNVSVETRTTAKRRFTLGATGKAKTTWHGREGLHDGNVDS